MIEVFQVPFTKVIHPVALYQKSQKTFRKPTKFVIRCHPNLCSLSFFGFVVVLWFKPRIHTTFQARKFRHQEGSVPFSRGFEVVVVRDTIDGQDWGEKKMTWQR